MECGEIGIVVPSDYQLEKLVEISVEHSKKCKKATRYSVVGTRIIIECDCGLFEAVSEE